MNKRLLVTLISTLVLAVFSFRKPSLAAERCETQYGGSQVCVTTGQLQINKKVWDPDRNDWVDNLYITDHKFQTSDFVRFKLIIKNIGDDTLHEVKVTDTLPSFLFFTGATPSEFKFDYFNPGVTEEREVEARVVSESQLKVEQECDVNTAEVTSKEDFKDKDTAKLCVTKKVLGVTTLPKTGPSNTFLILSLSAIAGLAGLALVKFSQKLV